MPYTREANTCTGGLGSLCMWPVADYGGSRENNGRWDREQKAGQQMEWKGIGVTLVEDAGLRLWYTCHRVYPPLSLPLPYTTMGEKGHRFSAIRCSVSAPILSSGTGCPEATLICKVPLGIASGSSQYCGIGCSQVGQRT